MAQLKSHIPIAQFFPVKPAYQAYIQRFFASPVLLGFFIFFQSFYLLAETTYITDLNKTENITTDSLFLLDETSQLTFDEILNNDSQHRFKTSAPTTGSFGFTEATVWLKIVYRDQRSTPTKEDLVLEISNPILDHIEIYRPSAKGWTQHLNGQMEGYDNREIKHPNFLFYLPDATNQNVTVYLKIKSETPLAIPHHIRSIHGSFASGSLNANSSQVFIGLFLLILFYNFILALTVREIEQYFYVAWIFLVTLASSFLSGVGQAYFGPIERFIAINYWAIGSLIATTFLLYTTSFLNLKNRHPKLHKTAQLIAALFTLNCLFILVTDYRLWQWTLLMCGLSGGIIIFMFGYGIYLKHRTSYLGLIAFSPALTGLITYILASANLITNNWWTFNAIFIGMTLTAVTISLTMGNRVNEEKRKRYLLEKKNSLTLEANNALLTKSNAVKDAFISTISHELRTPLNGAFASLSLLEAQINELAEKNNFTLPEDTTTYFKIMHNSNNEIIHLINSIIGFSELHDAHTQVNPHYFSPYQPIISLIELRRDLINQKDIEVRIDIHSLQPIQVMTDEEKYKKVIGIIFDNAIKFTEKGSITIRGSIEKLDSEHTKLTVSFTDTGIGIPASKLETITEPFSQADQSYTRKFGGLGIGLAVCKKTLALLAGEIIIHSEEKKGTSVELVFEIAGFRTNPQVETASTYPTKPPVEAPPPNSDNEPKINALNSVSNDTLNDTINNALNNNSDNNQDNNTQTHINANIGFCAASANSVPTSNRQKAANDANTDSQPINILIVEDNVANQMVTTKIIKKMGYTPLLAENGAIAVEMVCQQAVDLILMDCQMPVMDGFEATRKIRSLTNCPKTLPIIAVTANTSDKDQRQCRDCGMDDFLAKPITYPVLSLTIKKWLALKSNAELHEDQRPRTA